MNNVFGYLFRDCGFSGVVWEYLPVQVCRGHCMGEAVLVRGGMFGAHAISRQFSRSFAEWRKMSTFADRQRIAGGSADPYKFADACGLQLAVRLRDEIGSGPIIVFEKRERNRCGGPHMWRISDEGEAKPYFHVPHIGYVVDLRTTAAPGHGSTALRRTTLKMELRDVAIAGRVRWKSRRD